MKEKRTLYECNIQDRSTLRYYIGLIVRWKQHFKYKKAVRIARRNGATIGEGVIMPIALAKKVNHNVTIGNHVSIATSDFSSFRYPIKIGNNVIIGSNVRFTMGSHNIDSPDWEHCRPNEGLVIEDYVWLCPNCTIMPSVKKIGYGAVVGAESVVVKDVEEMSVVSGFPVKELRKRKCVHSDLIVESLLGGDYEIYRKTRNKAPKQTDNIRMGGGMR